MSLAGWRKGLDEKIQVDEETDAVRDKLRMHKINKEFNRLTGEELFKPITERVDKAAAAPTPALGGEAPGYDIEAFDPIYPFNLEDFNPQVPTPCFASTTSRGRGLSTITTVTRGGGFATTTATKERVGRASGHGVCEQVERVS